MMIFRARSTGKTVSEASMENVSSPAVSGTVLNKLPPRYTNPIWIASTAVIITIKAGFFDMFAKRRSLSVLALKQLNTPANMKNAKNPVR